MGAWENLSMREKAEMMKVAIRNGITTLPEIRQAYNEFAGGGAMPEAQPENDGWSMEDEAKYREWRSKLPSNLKNTNDNDYDMREAYKAGMQPTLEDDGFYHLGSRNPKTGRILKAPHHPTYLKAINTDARMGYYPRTEKGITYTDTWEGNLFGGGGYKPSERIKQRIAHYEGKAMTGATDPLSGKWAKNNSFESEASRFYSALPEDIRGQVLSNPELADNLYSYSYNVGAGNFKKRVVPALRDYYAGKVGADKVADSLWASGDSKLRGLRRRRSEEKAGVMRALTGGTRMSEETLPLVENFPAYTPWSPISQMSYEAPVIEETVTPTIDKAYTQEELDRQERRDRLDRFNMLMSLSSPQQDNGMLGAIGILSSLGTANAYREGGDIHIKPENRGKFTALKERTGHSATWFKEHGTPAQKKMATFALNARHWKHGLGGNLFDGLSESSQQMSNGYYRQNGNPVAFDSEGNLIDQVSGDRGTIMLPEYTVTGHTPTMWGRMVSRAGEVWNTVRGPIEKIAMTAGNLPFAIYGGLSKLAADAFTSKDTYASAHTPFGEGLGHERDNIVNVANSIAGERNRLEMMGFRNVDNKYKYPKPGGMSDDEYLKWCAENANIISGYYGHPTAGDAWTRHGIYGDSAIVQAPYTKDEYYIPRASNKARSMSKDQARYVAAHIDDPGIELKSGDIVDMRYPKSSFTSEAWNTGDKKLPNTHTGTIIKTGPRKEDTYVAHYFNGGLQLEPIGDLIGVSWIKPYVTGIRRAGTKGHPYK